MKTISLDQNLIDYTDQATWDLMCEGDTVGVFQLESRLGRKTSREAKPTNLEELSDLGAILRPGCMQSKLADGKSLTHHYIERKNSREAVEYVHPALETILKNTYATPVYQENLIEIGVKLGNMTLAQADLYLRFAIGKKKASLIEKGKEIFLKGCAENNIGEKDAKLIFSWVESAARYGFNKSVCPSCMVQTPKGCKQLQDVEIGDEVLAPGKNGDGFVKVSGKYDHGALDCYEIELECGKKIKCTMDHKFLCQDGQIRPLYDILLYFHEIIHQDGALTRKKEVFNKITVIRSPWTIKEDTIIKNNLHLPRKKITSLLPNRTLASVKSRMREL